MDYPELIAGILGDRHLNLVLQGNSHILKKSICSRCLICKLLLKHLTDHKIRMADQMDPSSTLAGS